MLVFIINLAYQLNQFGIVDGRLLVLRRVTLIVIFEMVYFTMITLFIPRSPPR